MCDGSRKMSQKESHKRSHRNCLLRLGSMRSALRISEAQLDPREVSLRSPAGDGPTSHSDTIATAANILMLAPASRAMRDILRGSNRN